MNQKINHDFDTRDKLIAALKKENEIQRELIKEQKNTIKMLKDHVSDITKLMEDFWKSCKKG